MITQPEVGHADSDEDLSTSVDDEQTVPYDDDYLLDDLGAARGEEEGWAP